MDRYFSLDQTTYFTKNWYSAGDPIATLIIVHGHGEHIEQYILFANYFTSCMF